MIREIHASRVAPMALPRVHAELRLGSRHPGRPQASRAADASRGPPGCDPAASTGHHPTRPSTRCPMTIWWPASSPLTAPTGSGWRTSPSTPPTRARSICAVVIDAWNRQVVGQSIADHLRAELVVDAFDMACWRRRPARRSDGPPQRPRHPIHVVGVRSAAPPRRPARLDGHRRRRPRQRRRRELLRDPADRAPRPPPLDHATPARASASSSGSRSSTTSSAGTRPSACSTPSPTHKTARTPLRHDLHHHTPGDRRTGGTPPSSSTDARPR